MPWCRYPEIAPRTWLRELRGARTHAEIGEPHGLLSGTLSAYEQGNGFPSIATIPRLAAAYGIDRDEMARRFMAEADRVAAHGTKRRPTETERHG